MYDIFSCRPHTADQPRYIDMQVNELRNPVPVPPRPLPQPADLYGEPEEEYTTHAIPDPRNSLDLSHNSPLNIRYTDQRTGAISPPPLPHERPAPVGGDMKLSESSMNDRYNRTPDLSPSKMNERYKHTNGPVNGQNGVPNGMNGERRYEKNPSTAYPNDQGGRNVNGKLNRRFPDIPDDERSVISIHSHTDPRQVDRWLDKVFGNVFTEVDDLSDVRSLKNHMKGGGQGIPGMQGVSILASIFCSAMHQNAKLWQI